MSHRLQARDTFSRTPFHEDFEYLVQFDPSSTSIEKISFEKNEILAMGQLCEPIVADRHNMCQSLYAQKIPAKVLNMLREKKFQIMVSSHRGSPLKKRPKSDYLGSP